MDNLFRGLVKEGRSLNELYNEPYYELIKLVTEEHKEAPKKEQSLISAFAGTGRA